MKKYSAFFWWMMILSLLFGIMSINYAKIAVYGPAIIFIIISFTLWFFGVMSEYNSKKKIKEVNS